MAPGDDFGLENGVPAPLFRCVLALGVSSCQVNKTLRWLAKIEVRPSHARTKKRRKFDVVAVRTRFGVSNALGLRPSVVWMASGGSPDVPRDVLGAS